jgi:DNA-binding MarR family transcriptional regulator
VDSITVQRLAKTLNVSQSALTHDITTLERAGYIEIRPDTKDSGQRWIALSAKGLAALANHEIALQAQALGPT